MKLIIFSVLITYVAFVAGDGNAQAMTKALSLSTSTRDLNADLAIIVNYLIACPGALTHYENCLVTHNYNPNFNQNNLGEVCTAARIELTCFESTFAATSCAGLAEAINAGNRARSEIETLCSGSGSGAASASVIALFVTTYMVAIANLLH